MRKETIIPQKVKKLTIEEANRIFELKDWSRFSPENSKIRNKEEYHVPAR